jgi:uncharacterized protein
MDATADDLTKPLGMEPRTKGFTLPRLPVAPVLSAVLAAFLVGTGGYIAAVEDPLGGEPHALVPIGTASEPARLPPASSPPASRSLVEGAAPPRQSASEIESASGVSVVRPQGMGAPGAVVIQVPETEGIKLLPAPDPRLVERTRYGSLPKRGADGARAAQVYARPSGALPGGGSAAARVAVLVTGLGISHNATAGAIANLPPAVTLAFAPYGSELDRHVGRARDDGHEVMLQVPMEPFDYPDNDPGPHTLTARGKTEDNIDKLHWAMGRFTGYTGLVNFMGAKLTADEGALGPILREIGRRGLVFLDDGSSSRSLVATVAPASGTPVSRADLVLDAAARPELIDKELQRLEELALKKGFAIGTASALPLTVERIARWARALESRNILLVPVSHAFADEARR